MKISQAGDITMFIISLSFWSKPSKQTPIFTLLVYTEISSLFFKLKWMWNITDQHKTRPNIISTQMSLEKSMTGVWKDYHLATLLHTQNPHKQNTAKTLFSG